MVNLDMRSMQDHYPSKDDQVLAWLKDRRDEYPEHSTAYTAVNFLVAEYTDAAETMRSLEEVVNLPVAQQEGIDNLPKLKKKPRSS